MPAPTSTPQNFPDMLAKVWWRLDRALDRDMIRASAQAAAIAALRAGTTLVIDHHSSPRAAAGSLALIADALELAGLSCLPCIELSDRDGAQAREQGLAETEAYLAAGRPGLVGLHASFTVGDELLDRAVALADRFATGLHLHVAEAEDDPRHCVATYGCRVVERLERHGALRSARTILAHCLHLDDRERRLLRDSPVWVAENSESNANNAVGVFSSAGLAGERILLGSDGLHGDMRRAMQASYFRSQSQHPLTPAEAWQRLQAVHRYAASIHGTAGVADLVALRYDPPTPLTEGTAPAHAVFALPLAPVEAVVARGRLVLAGGRVLSLDEPAVMAEARHQAERLWRAMLTL
jgi:cytosine/adenosine deaminase-related metal-dependent hydrolase